MTLDAAHALMNQGVSRDLRPRPRNVAKREQEKAARRRAHEEATYDDIYRTLPEITKEQAAAPAEAHNEQRRLGLPEENLLYFLEKNAPKLEDWQRELLRIVRLLSQYFYPQRQTKMMNEGCATFVHYEIMNRLYEQGQLTDGTMLEFLHSHSSVIYQPGFNSRQFSGINPYALGFAMMNDIRRIVTEPTEEDREWFPDIAGTGDWMGTLRQAWVDYRDESFVRQYLSPKLIRDLRLFAVDDDAKESTMDVAVIHNEQGYRDLRRRLAQSYDVAAQDPDLQITDQEYFDAGNGWTVCKFMLRCTNDGPFLGQPATGKPVAIGVCEWAHWNAEGQAVGGDMYPSFLPLLKQLGVIQPN